MPPDARPNPREPLRVSLLVLPDATIGSVTGMFDVLSCFPLLGTFDDSVPRSPPFAVELIASSDGPVPTASGLALPVHRSIADQGRTDIAIVPSLMVAEGDLDPGPLPRARGVAAAACTGREPSSARPARACC